MRSRTLLACTALVVALGACGAPASGTGASASSGSATAAPGGDVTSAGRAALPAVQPATEPADAVEPPPVPAAPETPLPAEVVTRTADLVVRGERPLDAAAVEAVDALPGVGHVAPVAAVRLEVAGTGDAAPVDGLVVDHETFRPFTPAVTAQAAAVWERLRDGDVVLGHDVAHAVEAELGGAVTLATDANVQVVRAGAFAANGAPPFGDVLVPHDVAELLGLPSATGLLVAVGEAADVDAVAEQVRGLLGGVEVERRLPPVAQVAAAAPVDRLEAFTFTDLGDGTISIDPDWVARWIVPVEIPGIATTRCHRIIVPQLLAALAEIEALGLYDHFKPEQFGGCWVARRIDWSPDRPLSNHAWGTAIDFNTHDNWLGETPMMDRRIVAVFEKWGFEWGGHWSRPDGMHFELDRVVVPG